MKKILLTLLLLLLCAVLPARAQESDIPVSPAEAFTDIRVRNPFSLTEQAKYYRFPNDTFFFEPIDLEVFPVQESWNKKNWALLGRLGNGHTYNQLIFTEVPAAKQMIHGTDVTEMYGFLNDFYLYAELFAFDNYPENTGSCYIYYSNSLLTGYYESKGILIDPRTGIYSITNSYGGERIKIYNPYLIKHTIEQIEEHTPDEYPFDPEDPAASSVGAASRPLENLDASFTGTLEYLNSESRMQASPDVKAWRVEVIRRNGISDIYINGKQVTSIEDPIRTEAEDGSLVPDRVSWSYGPILEPGGLTVTCGISKLLIYSLTRTGG